MSGTRDWDASTYERVSDPMFELGLEVLERLPLEGSETVLDAGCGSGRVTQKLLDRLPHGRVVAVDASSSMVELAREALDPARTAVHVADLAELELAEPVHAALSTAVFHWIPDHPRLFARLHAALRPGGRLEAQCGGRGNLAGFHDALHRVQECPPFSESLGGWTGPWNFAGPEETTERLERAGFAEVACWLEERLIRPDDAPAYLRTICLGHHLERLPDTLAADFVEAVEDEAGRPLELPYVRLNISARRRPA